jgi:hypothetical protein
VTLLELLPVLAYAGAIAVILGIALGRGGAPARPWLLPAGLGAAFLLFSAVTVAREGLLQFWVNHTANLAGNQVWFDLLIAVGIAFWLIAPRARAVGMALLPWAVAVVATASIALLPMLARLVWLEQRGRARG